MVTAAQLQDANLNKLTDKISAFDVKTLPGTEQAHTTFKALMPTSQPLRRAGDRASDAAAGVWHFKVGDNQGPVMKISFDRTDIPMAREARTNRARTADIWQLRELYNTSIKLVGFPGILPGQIIYVTPNLHMFGNPRAATSTARVLGLGGYHIVVSTDNEITPAGYTTTLRALHEALPEVNKALVMDHTNPTGVEEGSGVAGSTALNRIMGRK